MSFNTALSGLNAATSDLAVISNNIANVNTTGFKNSRAEFGDIYATSAFGSGRTSIGSGVLLSNVAQQFGQGNLQFTSNALDLAVSGEGFFVLAPTSGSTEKIFSRAGAFGVDANGFVVNSSGQFLQTFPVNAADGTVTSSSLSSTQNLQLPQTAGLPQQSLEIDVGMNLPSNAAAPTTGINGFDSANANSYNSSTSVSFFDSLGNTHIQTFYFVKDNNIANPNTWAVYTEVDGDPVNIAGGTANTLTGQRYATLVFDNAGGLDTTAPAPTTSPDPAGVVLPGLPAVAPISQRSVGTFVTERMGTDNNVSSYQAGPDPDQYLIIDFASNSVSQVASPFTVNELSQDGFGVGRLSGLDISDTGVVRANFSNGQSTAIGKVALAKFSNPQGLRQLGSTNWGETIDSGVPLAGEAGTSSFGTIRSGALESSNVDLTKELVNLITAQRNFQANSRAIETANTTTQTILQIR